MSRADRRLRQVGKGPPRAAQSVAVDPRSAPDGPETVTVRVDANSPEQVEILLANLGLGPQSNHVSPVLPHIACYHPFAPGLRIVPAAVAADPQMAQYLVDAMFCCHCGRLMARYKGEPFDGHGPYLVFERPSAVDQLHLPG